MKKENGKIEVARVVIKVGGKELSLTPAEVEELRGALNQTFGKQCGCGYHYHYHQLPYTPTYIYGNATSTITWDTTSGTTTQTLLTS